MYSPLKSLKVLPNAYIQFDIIIIVVIIIVIIIIVIIIIRFLTV